MSREELQRFTQNLAADPDLADEFAKLGNAPEQWQREASRRGYELTLEEAKGLSASRYELSEEDLEEVAGGWDGSGSGTSTTEGGGGG